MPNVDHTRRVSLARKLIATLVTGLVTYVLANLVGIQLSLELGMAIFFGSVVFVVTYLIEVDHRLGDMETNQQQHATSIERMLAVWFNKVSSATGSFARLDSSETPTDLVMKLIDDISRLDSRNGLVFNLAQSEVKRMARLMHDLTHGKGSVYEGEDRDWMLSLTRIASRSIDAISITTEDLGVDGGLWLTDLGQRYLQLQSDAIARKVVTRRVFLAENAERLNRPDFLEICRMHRRLGVEVRLLELNDAPGTPTHIMSDFVVFDGILSYESVPASQRTNRTKPITLITTQLVLDEARVLERVQRFSELWNAARELD